MSGPATSWSCAVKFPEAWNARDGRMDTELPPDARPLMVGQAAVFHLDHKVAYNTVFNPETIEQLAKGRTAEEFRRALEDRNLTHVYVDWKEITRHRQPGGYGFSDFVTPVRFAGWVAAGVLEPAQMMGAEQELYEVRPVGEIPSTWCFVAELNRYGPLSWDECMDGLTVVTGGAGFIGSHLVQELVDSGQQSSRDREAGSGSRSPARRRGRRFRGHSRSRSARTGV